MKDNGGHAMDGRWLKALRAKGINVNPGAHGRRTTQSTQSTQPAQHTERHTRSKAPRSGAVSARTKPFKATGHKGGISRQGV